MSFEKQWSTGGNGEAFILADYLKVQKISVDNWEEKKPNIDLNHPICGQEDEFVP